MIHIRTYQNIRGRPFKRQNYVESKKFKKRPGKWDPVKTAHPVKNDWVLAKNYFTILERDICTKGI